MTQTDAVDISSYTFTVPCEMGCESPAAYVVKGCMDKAPVTLCEEHYQRGLHAIIAYVHMYQRVNKRVLICSDCYRPVLSLETHMEVKPL